MAKSIRERYPPPWDIEEIPAGFRVRAANGMPLVYIYAPDEATLKAISSTGLTRSEALAIARAIVRLAEK